MHDPLETERLLLSVVMNAADDPFGELEGLVDANDFWAKPHRLVFESAAKISADGGLPVPILLAQDLEATGTLAEVGGLPGLTEISALYASRTNLDHLAHRVAAFAGLRATKDVADRIARLAESDPADLERVVDESGQMVDGLASRVSRSTVEPISNVLAEYRRQMDQPVLSVPTGFAQLDDLIGGYTKGDLSLVGAPSGHGKTSALVVSAIAACRAGRPTVFQTLEMSEAELINRMVAVLAQINLTKITRRQMTTTQRQARDAALMEIESWPLTIDPDPDPSIGGMKSKARSIRRDYGEVGLWLFDYIQLAKLGVGRTHNRQEEVAEVSRTLKKFAKTEDVPVVGAVQLNNQATSRMDKRPQMNDIRESSAPYHDASVVVFVFRPGALGEVCENENDTELIVRKQRNGPDGTIHVDWVPQYSTFSGKGAGKRFDPYASAMKPAVNAGEDGSPQYENYVDTDR